MNAAKVKILLKRLSRTENTGSYPGISAEDIQELLDALRRRGAPRNVTMLALAAYAQSRVAPTPTSTLRPACAHALLRRALTELLSLEHMNHATMYFPDFGQHQVAALHQEFTAATARGESFTLSADDACDLMTVYVRCLPEQAASLQETAVPGNIRSLARANPRAKWTLTPGDNVGRAVQTALRDLAAHYAAQTVSGQTGADTECAADVPTLTNPYFDAVDVFSVRDALVRADTCVGVREFHIPAGVAADLLTVHACELPERAALTIPAQVAQDIRAAGQRASTALLKLDLGAPSPALLAIRVAVGDLVARYSARTATQAAATAVDPVQALNAATFDAAELHSALAQPGAAGDALVQLDALPAYALAKAVQVRVPSGTGLHAVAGALMQSAAGAVLSGQRAVQVRGDLTRTLLSKVYAPVYSLTREEYEDLRQQVRGQDSLPMLPLKRLLSTLTAFTGIVPSPLRTLSALTVQDAPAAQVGRHLDTLLAHIDVAALTWDRALDGPARPWPLAVVR
ncbi:hypothetical protein [Deinococcus kurensis]|uniref:hypothetical protein n=1 Tax=Deinococcus kurensis TaxID=2662757 RepID=UPI0012D2D7DA|nr:hypothetical protein [Deinococcus kurensis]